MKYVKCDGRVMEVYDLGPALVRVSIRLNGPPIKTLTGVYGDDEARDLVRRILGTRLYDRIKVDVFD